MIIKTNIWSIPHTQKTPTIPKSNLNYFEKHLLSPHVDHKHSHIHRTDPHQAPLPGGGGGWWAFSMLSSAGVWRNNLRCIELCTPHGWWRSFVVVIKLQSNRIEAPLFFCLVVFWRDRNPKVDVVLCTDVPRQRELHLLYLHKRNPKRFAEENAPHITSKKSGKTTKKYAKLHERSLIFLFFPVERSRRKTRFRWLNRFSTFPFCSCLRRASAEECLQTDHHSLTTPLCEAEPCVENQNRSNSGMQQRELFRKQK